VEWQLPNRFITETTETEKEFTEKPPGHDLRIAGGHSSD